MRTFLTGVLLTAAAALSLATAGLGAADVLRTDIAAVGAAEAAELYGAQAAPVGVCGQSGPCVPVLFCWINSRVDTCSTWWASRACASTLCPYDCTVTRLICP